MHSSLWIQNRPLQYFKNERGKSYWKFNNSLLKDREYIKIVKKTIKDVLETYKNRELQQESTNSQNINGINSNDNNNNNNNNNIPNGNTNNEEYTINDQMLFGDDTFNDKRRNNKI